MVAPRPLVATLLAVTAAGTACAGLPIGRRPAAGSTGAVVYRPAAAADATSASEREEEVRGASTTDRVAAPERPARPPRDPALLAAARRDCLAHLDALDVPYRALDEHPGVDIPVEVVGSLGGVIYFPYVWTGNLILDCSLVYSLSQAGVHLRQAGYDRARYSSATIRRNIRGTRKPSSHSFGLALDVHYWETPFGERLSVTTDYETGLDTDEDCVGSPATEKGALLRRVYCAMDESGLFRFVLSPDTDASHRDHFHIEVEPWVERMGRPGGSS